MMLNLAFVTMLFFAPHNKSLLWNPVPEQHIYYWTVEMQGGPNLWFRIGSTYQARFQLPYGPYTRTFRVRASVDQSIWPFPDPPPSLPFTTHL